MFAIEGEISIFCAHRLGEQRKAQGDVIAVKLDDSNKPINFPLEEFNLIWGMMVIIPCSNVPGFATGSIFPRTPEWEERVQVMLENAVEARSNKRPEMEQPKLGNRTERRKQQKKKKRNGGFPDFETMLMNQVLGGRSYDDGGCYGFTADEVDELLCQGVKPWDDDSPAVLAALNGYDSFW